MFSLTGSAGGWRDTGVCREHEECLPRDWSVSASDHWAASPACARFGLQQPRGGDGAFAVLRRRTARPREGMRQSGGGPGSPKENQAPRPCPVHSPLSPHTTSRGLSPARGCLQAERVTRPGVPAQHAVVPGGTLERLKMKGVWRRRAGARWSWWVIVLF